MITKARLKANTHFKNDKITKAVNVLNETLIKFGYKCNGLTLKHHCDAVSPLYVINGYIVTEETYKSIERGNSK